MDDTDMLSNDNQNTVIPNALFAKGYNLHAYIILIGALIGMLPTVLDSLLVSYFIFHSNFLIESNKNPVPS